MQSPQKNGIHGWQRLRHLHNRKLTVDSVTKSRFSSSCVYWVSIRSAFPLLSRFHPGQPEFGQYTVRKLALGYPFSNSSVSSSDLDWVIRYRSEEHTSELQ